MSAHSFPFVGLAARAASPDFVARAKRAEGPFGLGAGRPPQGVGTTGRTGLSRCDSRFCGGFFERPDAGFECVEPRRLGFECFPERKLIEEFHDVGD